MANGKSGPCNGCNADFMVIFADGRSDAANPNCMLPAIGPLQAQCTATASCLTVGMGAEMDGDDYLDPAKYADVSAAITGLGVRQTPPGTCDMDFADDVSHWMSTHDVAIGTPGHSWQITAQGKSGQAKKGMVNAAKVMAGVAVEALGDASLIARAKADLKARHDVMPYVCPMPDAVKPPLQPRPGT